ncbi:MAG: protein-L-isoaspartate(D-aspartate) O-methyltransferase [Burkholderiaceae bacterium]|jgi:protein-L-isoaspartate(D-aspartate) O-methyltransferase|nr:protein-L-isoaspartate(D-aspartate) O-methyltransferase [Burkholderiaceae bacterium]
MAGGKQRPGFPARVLPGPAHGQAPARRAVAALPLAAPAGGLARDPIPARGRMVQQLAAGGIHEPAVLHAMSAVERHRFVDSALAPQAYEDTALPIGLGQTISKPSVVARMLELLLQGGVRDEDGRLGRVLDIGTGCGYQAVALAQLASEVYSIERLRDLHEKARANLRPLRLASVHLILGDGAAGFAAGAPYAGIVAAAGGEQVPDAWIEQLAIGGRIVAPLAAGGGQALVVVDKTRQGVTHKVLEAVNFVPLKSGIA